MPRIRYFAPARRRPDQHDACSVAAWMRQADNNGTLVDFFNPSLMPDEQALARAEGWIFGVK